MPDKAVEWDRDTGYVEIVAAPLGKLPGGYPIEATPEHSAEWEEAARMAKERGELHTVSMQEMMAEVERNQPRIRFRVHHGTCDPDPGRQGYVIGCSRARDPEEWLSWVYHLAEKGWMAASDLQVMAGLWWANRGQEKPCS